MYKAPFDFLIPWILSQFFIKIVNKVEVVIEMKKKTHLKIMFFYHANYGHKTILQANQTTILTMKTVQNQGQSLTKKNPSLQSWI